MKFRLYEVTSIPSNIPGRYRGGTSNLEKKLGLSPKVLYGRVVREQTTYLNAQYFPVEHMTLEQLLALPMSVYFDNIGPRLGYSKQLCGRIHTTLFNINRNYLLSANWKLTTLGSLVALLKRVPRGGLRIGANTSSKTIDAFYACLQSRELLPAPGSEK